MPKRTDQTLPHLSAELIQDLDEQFPHRCLKPGQTMEDALRYAGRRQLIDELVQRLNNAERKPRRG